MHVGGDEDQGGDVHGELTKDGWNDVPVPDVVLRALFRELLDTLRKVLAIVA